MSATVAAAIATQPFSLLVGLTFKTKAALETFKTDMAPLAAYVKAHEPGTLAYEVLLLEELGLRALRLEPPSAPSFSHRPSVAVRLVHTR
jgi:hypothetical protein